MKSTLITLARQVAVSGAALIAVMLCATLAYAWTGPSQSAPSGNAATLLNTSATSQTKTGALTLGSGAASVVVSSGGLAANTFCLGGECITEWPSQADTVPSGTLCGAWVGGSNALGDYHTPCQGLPRGECPSGYTDRRFYEAHGVHMYGCHKI